MSECVGQCVSEREREHVNERLTPDICFDHGRLKFISNSRIPQRTVEVLWKRKDAPTRLSKCPLAGQPTFDRSE